MTPPGAWQPVKSRDRAPHDSNAEPVPLPDTVEVDPEPAPPEPPIPEVPEPEPVEAVTTPPANDDHAPASPICTFCGRSIDAPQFAWPDWLCDFLTEHQQNWDVQRTEPESALPIIDQVGQEIDQTSTAVCETCNTGWIQRLEENVSPFLKPMILGEPTPLPAARRKLLARWAAKTAIVMEGTFPEAIRTPRVAAEYLRLTGVHAGTQVLVGRYEGDSQVLNRARVLFRKTSDEDHYRSFTTLIIGELAIQVLADPWTDGVPDVPEKAQRRFIPLVSANARKAEWPPELAVGDSFFDAVRRPPSAPAANPPTTAPDPATPS